MCEPHTAGDWRDSPLKSHTRDPQHFGTAGSTAAMSPEEATTTRPSHSKSRIISPISPPSSPPTTCHGFQPLQPQSIDVLASKLGSSSLSQYHRGSTAQLPAAALSPVSLPDDEFGHVQSLLSQHDSGSMEVDGRDDNRIVTAPNTTVLENRQYSISSASKAFNVPPPIVVDPSALVEVPRTVSKKTYRSITTGALEVDEGYCEDEENLSWLQAPVSLRSAGMPDGIKKRYDLGYRRSADAASRCRNTIHSVPRMRRRDKKKSRQPQSIVASGMGLSDVKGSQMVTWTQ
ncbi:hypothetical protein F66182_10510 [Fusarium sp. NRRL 66182]|nr:hypothetical protein F66182_10510 [Fusarium sp. NRRL 66182]